MALVVCSPDVYGLVEAPLDELIVVVGDVRGEVGGGPGGADQHVVLVFAQGGGTEPLGALPPHYVGPLAQLLHGPLVLAALIQAAFAEPAVELHPYMEKVVLDHLDHLLASEPSQLTNGLIPVHVPEAVPLLGHYLLGQVADICPHVAIGRHLFVPPQSLHVVGVHRGVEGLHLTAGVVDVVLLGDRIAGRLQHPGQSAAEDGPSGVAHVHGPGWVDADELNQDLLARSHLEVAVLLPCLEDGLQLRDHPPVPETEIDESRGRCPDLLNLFSGDNELYQLFGDPHGAYAAGPGQPQWKAGGEVAMLGVGRVAPPPPAEGCRA